MLAALLSGCSQARTFRLLSQVAPSAQSVAPVISPAPAVHHAERMMHAIWSRAFVKSNFETQSSPVAFGSGLLVMEIPSGIAAIDPRNGRRLWASARATDGVLIRGGYVFANHSSLWRITPDDEDNTLIALNARTGAVLWKKPKMGGVKVADSTGLFVSNFMYGTTFYSDGGGVRWHSARARGGIAIALDGPYVAVVGSGGEPSRGVLYSVDRKTGHYFGTNPNWIGRILETGPSLVTAVNTFPGEVSLRCLGGTLISVALLHESDPSDLDPFLAAMTRYYAVSDAPIPKDGLPCVGDRGPAAVAMNRSTLAVSSGHLTALYDRGRPGRRVFLDEAQLVGDPFAGYFFVSNTRGLDAVRLDSEHVTRFRLLSRRVESEDFSVARQDDRIYVSDGNDLYVFDANRLSQPPGRKYDLKCPQGITEIAHAGDVDVLECDSGIVDGYFSGRVVGLPVH